MRHKFYNTAQWKRLRDLFFKEHPLCEECQRQGIVKVSQIVDHIVPIENGGSKTDVTNLRALCQSCHNKKHFEKVN